MTHTSVVEPARRRKAVWLVVLLGVGALDIATQSTGPSALTSAGRGASQLACLGALAVGAAPVLAARHRPAVPGDGLRVVPAPVLRGAVVVAVLLLALSLTLDLQSSRTAGWLGTLASLSSLTLLAALNLTAIARPRPSASAAGTAGAEPAASPPESGPDAVAEENGSLPAGVSRLLLEHSRDVTSLLSPDLSIRYVTPSVEAMLGWRPDELPAVNGGRLLHPDDHAKAQTLHVEARQRGESWATVVRLRHADGRYRDVNLRGRQVKVADESLWLFNARDVSAEVTTQVVREYDPRERAERDPLSGLATRRVFAERLQTAITDGDRFAVLFLDLDDFKVVNDSLGHLAGDLVLQTLSQRLQQAVRPVDLAARMGGDEFAVLVRDVDADDAVVAAHQITAVLSEAIDTDELPLLMNVSIGVATFDGAQQDAPTAGQVGVPARRMADAVVNDADAAMYLSKRAGGARVTVWAEQMRHEAASRLRTLADLTEAVAGRQFVPHYQPQVDMATGAVHGVEALARWRHPERGLLPPSAFLDVAEPTPLIADIGWQVMEQACRDAARWRTELPELGSLPVSVNLAARQVQSPDVVSRVAQILADTGLPAQLCTIEITESTLLHQTSAVLSNLHGLHRLGVQVSLDDFGTGYSSLAYLRKYPVDQFKLAKEFVDEVADEADAAGVVATIRELARGLRLSTVAEGVETPRQRDALLDLGFRVAQGYLYARPMPERELRRWLLTNATANAASAPLVPVPGRRGGRGQRSAGVARPADPAPPGGAGRPGGAGPSAAGSAQPTDRIVRTSVPA